MSHHRTTVVTVIGLTLGLLGAANTIPTGADDRPDTDRGTLLAYPAEGAKKPVPTPCKRSEGRRRSAETSAQTERRHCNRARTQHW